MTILYLSLRSCKPTCNLKYTWNSCKIKFSSLPALNLDPVLGFPLASATQEMCHLTCTPAPTSRLRRNDEMTSESTALPNLGCMCIVCKK